MEEDITFASVQLDESLLENTTFHFVGEGAANIVFAGVVKDGFDGDNALKGMCLSGAIEKWTASLKQI